MYPHSTPKNLLVELSVKLDMLWWWSWCRYISISCLPMARPLPTLWALPSTSRTPPLSSLLIKRKMLGLRLSRPDGDLPHNLVFVLALYNGHLPQSVIDNRLCVHKLLLGTSTHRIVLLKHIPWNFVKISANSNIHKNFMTFKVD